MANTQKQSTGYVIVGIADDIDDANRFSATYGAKNREYNGFYITGIQEEVRLKYKSPDEYFTKVKDLVKQEPISIDVQSAILRNIRLVQYFDKLLLVFSLSSDTKPIAYNNKFFERHASSVEEISDATEIMELFARFS